MQHNIVHGVQNNIVHGVQNNIVHSSWQLATSCELFKLVPGASSEVMPTKITKIILNLYIPKSYPDHVTFTVECQEDSGLDAGTLTGAWVLDAIHTS